METQNSATTKPALSKNSGPNGENPQVIGSDKPSEFMTLESYATSKDISLQAVWQLIQNGQVMARYIHGEVQIFIRDVATASSFEVNVANKNAPVPYSKNIERQSASLITTEHPSELSLLIDHLSLAKEENLELIRMTQTTLSEMRKSYESNAKLKDDALAEARVQSQKTQEKLDAANFDMNNLKQQIEDLKMLEKIRKS